jgi:hypothetical protein
MAICTGITGSVSSGSERDGSFRRWIRLEGSYTCERELGGLYGYRRGLIRGLVIGKGELYRYN